jgi:uncharacterized LabA/DUF88 family protein
MPFNTAIFYDIENLLKGYSFSQQMAANLSLEEILGAIRQTERVSQIAVQRAYANWSDPRLAIMRGEINELGIEPIQVFGFGRDQKKNAADIQLAIDAIDLAHVRPALDVFVIVSGDGGFASLAKKLHEYGKTVIGCAYRSAANKIFQAVCDDFVWITDPDEEERQERGPSPASTTGSQIVTDPRNVRLAGKLKPSKSLAPEDVLAKVKEVLNWYASDGASRADLERGGIFLSVVQEGVKFAVPGFHSIRYGFAKFSEFLQYACKGSPLCVARPANSQAVLIFRNAVRAGVETLPDLDVRDLHTVDGYRSLLATGIPVIRLPRAAELRAIAGWLYQHRPERADLGSIIEGAVNGLNGAISSEAAKLGILSLVSAQAFEREPEGTSLSEQKLTLRPDIRTPEGLLALVLEAARTKLLAILGQVRDDVLQQLLGENAELEVGADRAGHESFS